MDSKPEREKERKGERAKKKERKKKEKTFFSISLLFRIRSPLLPAASAPGFDPRESRGGIGALSLSRVSQRGHLRPAPRGAARQRKREELFFFALSTSVFRISFFLRPSSGCFTPILPLLPMDCFPKTGKRTRGLSSGSAVPWKRVAQRLGNEPRKRPSVTAAGGAGAAAAATTTATTATKQRESVDEDIADLLLSFARAPTKQVRLVCGGRKGDGRAGVSSAGARSKKGGWKTEKEIFFCFRFFRSESDRPSTFSPDERRRKQERKRARFLARRLAHPRVLYRVYASELAVFEALEVSQVADWRLELPGGPPRGGRG